MSSDANAAERHRYTPLRVATSHQVLVRGIPYHVREWGDRGLPILVMVHGSRDFGATFQFVVDALADEWHVIAPDWRGHGRSGWTSGSYWQAEFVADLGALLDKLALDRPIVLVGHSMGGNVASLYAAMAPDRVRSLVMLDAMGELLDRAQVDVRALLARFMAPAIERPTKAYRTAADFEARLIRHNPRLDPGRASFLASEWLAPDGAGLVRGGDPAFGRILPSLHRTEEWLAMWKRITAPVLYVSSTDHRRKSPLNDRAELHRRLAAFGDIRRVTAPDTGHNVHHDAAELIAALIERHAAGALPADRAASCCPQTQRAVSPPSIGNATPVT